MYLLMISHSVPLPLSVPVVVTDSELIGKRTMQLWGRRDGITQIINHWANMQNTAKMHLTDAHTCKHTHTFLTNNDHQWISG